MSPPKGPWGNLGGGSNNNKGSDGGKPSNPWHPTGGSAPDSRRPPNMGGPKNPFAGPSGNSSGGGSREGPQGPLPPGTEEIEALLRKGQERFRNFFRDGQGGGMGGGLGGIGQTPRGVLFVLVGFLALWLLSGFYQIAPNQLGVVLRFGEVVRIDQPGLRYHLPEPIEQAMVPDVTSINQIEIGYRRIGDRAEDIPDESFMLTSDENIIDIDFTVFWQVKPETAGRVKGEPSAVEQFLFNVRDPELTVKMAAESAIREVIGNINISPAISEAQGQIADETRVILQRMLDEYQSGIQITEVQLNKVDAPSQVVQAFRDVQNAAQDADRVQKEAIAYRNTILPSARADANRAIQEAEGYKQQVIAQATGESARFKSIYAAYSQNREAVAERLYLETMEEVLGNSQKIVVDQKGSGVLPYLPLQNLMKNPAAPRLPSDASSN